MKSKIYLILFALFAFSCSSDSSSDEGNNNGGNNNTGNALLVSEIITTDAESGYVYTSRYVYDGNKLTTITEEYGSDGNSQIDYLYNFVYTNNKISRVDEYYGDTSTGLAGRYTFEYDNQGRVSFYDYCNNPNSNGTCGYYDTHNLTYSSNGTVTGSYLYEVGTEWEEGNTFTLQLDNNGNIIEYTGSNQSEDNSGNPITVTVNASFLYDNQNSPFKNIVGMDAIMLLEFGSDILQFNVNNNCTSYIVYNDFDQDNYQYNYAYDYNEDGYPRQVIVSQGNYSSTIDINYN